MTTKLRGISQKFAAVLVCTLFFADFGMEAAEPIRLHPDNGHYFEFRRRPVVLMGSSEHYGALINLDFDYVRYLEETRTSGLNFIRIFSGTYMEHPGAFGISNNTLAPPPGRSVVPWRRTNQPGAADGGNKFDLNQWDPAYFYRLRDLVNEANKRAVVVELTFFSTIYENASWALSPMNGVNNINGVGLTGRSNSHRVDGDLFPFQKALVRKLVTELKELPNLIYEIVNEPYSGNIDQAFQDAIIAEVVATETGFLKRHLIAQNVFNFDGTVTNPNPAVSIFNFHYASQYAVPANYSLNKAIGDDETGFKGTTDLPYRHEAWKFMFSGGGLFNHLDYSYTSSDEHGDAQQIAPGGGGKAIRRQLGILRWFLEELPLTRLAPQPGFVISGVPAGAALTLGVPGEAYAVYIAGGMQANLVVNLPSGKYRGQWIDPRSGTTISDINEFTHGSGQRTLSSPNYSEDIALRLFGGNQPPPSVALTSPTYNTVFASDALTLTAEAFGSNNTFQWVKFFDGDDLLGVAMESPFKWVATNLAEGGHVFRANALSLDGRITVSPPVKVSVVGPFEFGVNLNGDSSVIAGEILMSQSEAETLGFLASNVQAVHTVADLAMYPTPDGPTRSLLKRHLQQVNLTNNGELSIVHPLLPGYYDVFLFAIEDSASHSRDMRVLLEGNIVARAIGDIAKGEWRQYGPYRVQVSDGILNIGIQKETKGTPQISAFKVFRAEAPPPLPDLRLQIESAEGLAVLTYPTRFPTVRLETSDSMTNSWQELNFPISYFSDRTVVPVPLEGSTRFFRLRMD